MKITKELVIPNYGLEGTQGKDGLPAIYTTVTNQNIVLNAPYQGLPSDYSKANGSIQVFEGDKEVTQQATYTLKQTLNVAATLDFNKFKVSHVSTDNGMFIVTVTYKEFVSDIMLTTNVVRNGQSGLDTYLYKAYSWSADGTDRFTTVYSNENLVTNKDNLLYTVSAASGLYMEKTTQGTGNDVKLTLTGAKEHSYLWFFSNMRKFMPYTKVGETYTLSFDMKTNRKISQAGISYQSTMTQCDVIRTNFDVLNVEKSSSEKVRIYVVFKPRTVAANPNYNLHFQSNAGPTITPSWIVDLENLSIQEGDTFGGVSVPSPQDDFFNAWPTYSGTYSSHDKVQSQNPKDYTWSRTLGESGKDGVNGKDGIAGKDGVGVKSTTIVYGISDSESTQPTTWTSSVPSLVKGKYLWTKTTWTYTDNTSEKGYSVTYISKDGNNGTDGIAGKDGVGIKTTTFKYGVSTSGTTKPSNWSTTIPTVPEGQFLWTETTWTYTDNTSEKGYSVAKQGAKGDKGDSGQQGYKGQDGPPTGIIESPTIPTTVYQGMLWKNTGNLSGFITDVTYIYRGSKWEKYIFSAENIVANSLSAITANLGDVTGGSFTGGKFINNFVDVPLLYNGTSNATGQTTIENGQIIIAGKIDNEFNLVTKYTVDAISSTIYYPNSTTVMKAFAITPDGFLLADHQNGFNGWLSASSLTKTPWITLPLRSGYLVAENNPPQYKIIYQLDGTKEVKFRGQVKRDTPMTAGSEHWFIQTPKTIYPPTTIMRFGATNTGNGCRVSSTTLGRLAVILGSTNATYVDISSLSYNID